MEMPKPVITQFDEKIAALEAEKANVHNQIAKREDTLARRIAVLKQARREFEEKQSKK